MIFSCTKKVLDKLKKHKPVENAKEEISLFNWYVDLINLERKNYFLFTNSKTLFSFFIYAGTKKELQNIEVLFEQKLTELITEVFKFSKADLSKLFPKNNEYRFVKTNSRTLLGSMNEFKYQIEAQLWDGSSLEEKYDFINFRLNNVLMGALGTKTEKYGYPIERMKQELKTKD